MNQADIFRLQEDKREELTQTYRDIRDCIDEQKNLIEKIDDLESIDEGYYGWYLQKLQQMLYDNNKKLTELLKRQEDFYNEP